MIPILQTTRSRLLGARWEYRGHSVNLTPTDLEPYLDARSNTLQQAKARSDCQTTGSQSAERGSASALPPNTKARECFASQSDLNNPWPPPEFIQYLPVPGATAPTMTSHPSNALHPPSLVASSQSPHYSRDYDIGMLVHENKRRPHGPTSQIDHPYLRDDNSSYLLQMPRVSEQNQQYPHRAHNTGFPYHPEPGTSNHSFEPRPFAHRWDVSLLPQSSSSRFPPQQQTYQANSSRHLEQSSPSQPATSINPGGFVPYAPQYNPNAMFTEEEIRLGYQLQDQDAGRAEYNPNSFTQEAFGSKVSPDNGNVPMPDNSWQDSMSRGG
jgi:hypothetical protein